jgi:uridine phosphorylase
MGAPSLSIVVNELVQVGIRTIIRVGTTGSIQAHVPPGSVVISKAALCRQGAANDIAPPEYPASADPFVTVALVEAAKAQNLEHYIGITASVDTFYEGQERTESANPHLMRSLQGITEEYRHLNILNYEMEAGTLFKMGNVYGFAAGCVCGVVAQRTKDEKPILESKAVAVQQAIDVAIAAAEKFFKLLFIIVRLLKDLRSRRLASCQACYSPWNFPTCWCWQGGCCTQDEY